LVTHGKSPREGLTVFRRVKDNRQLGELMTLGVLQQCVLRRAALLAILLAIPTAALAAQDTPRSPIAPPITAPPATAPVSSAAPAMPTSSASSGAGETAEARATAYFDFTVGHYYQLEYEVSSSSDDADQAIDYFKKAFEIDPASDVIGEQLAEMYFQSQRIRDAVLEAQSIIQRDPNNLGARRLLARIYVRTLGDLSDDSAQSDTARLAAEQYREILRLDPTDTDSALWLARLDRLQNKPDDAEHTLRDILSRDPDNEGAIQQLTQLLLDQQRGTEAVSMLEGIIARGPSAQLYDLLGDAETQQGEADKAEQAYRSAVQLDPDDTNHRSGLAQTLLSEEKYSEALEQYQHLAEMDSSDPDNYLRMAEIYRQLHQLDKAEQNVLEAEKRAPGNLEVVYVKSAIYEAEARFDDAIRTLSDAAAGVNSESEATPTRRRTLAVLYEQLGTLYREDQNYSAAVNTYQELGQLGPEEDHRAELLLIDTYRAERDMPHALDTAKKALEHYPGDHEVLTEQALLLGENGQTDEAASALRKLLDGKPEDDLEIQFDLAQVYQEGQRYAEAEQAAHAAAAAASKPAEQEMAGLVLGGVYEREKKYDQAEDQFKAVLALDPHDASVLNYYGYMLADRGLRLEEATSLIQRALVEDPNNPAYLDSLGWAYYKQNKMPDAEDSLRKALSFDGEDPTILLHMADVYAKSGQADLAVAEYQKSLDEWHRELPADVDPDLVAEVEQKLSNLKRHVAEQKAPGETAKPQ
jgi:tetratricopeptide (TPR) repeat protein